MAKDDPRLPLLEKQQEDLYREAVQRSERPLKAIAGRAVSRRKRAENFAVSLRMASTYCVHAASGKIVVNEVDLRRFGREEVVSGTDWIS